ncbi:hypothetical protein L195_g061582, partial [Trifolium pratense]
MKVLGHHEETARASSTLGLRTSLQDLTHNCHNNLPLKCEPIHSRICSPSSGSFLHPTLVLPLAILLKETRRLTTCQEDFR